MPTVTEIANLSLDVLGEAPVADVAGAGNTAVLMERNREAAWRETQASFPWSELLRQNDEIEAEEEQSPDGWWRYVVPEDCLRVLGVDGAWGALRYRLEGGCFLCRLSEGPRLHYIAYCDDPDGWGVQLTRAIVLQWAIRVCFALTQNPALKQALLQEYQGLVRPETRRLASYAHESRGHRRQQGRWLGSRSRFG